MSSVPLPAGSPFRRSATYRTHQALGASMIDYLGWRVAAHFASPGEERRRMQGAVGLADVSWLGKVDLRGHEPAGQATELGAALGALLAAAVEGEGRSERGALGPRRVWPLAQGHALVTCAPREVDAVLRAAGGRSAATTCAHATDVTSVYTAFLLAGPQSRATLAKLTELAISPPAIPNLSCAQTGLAHVHAIILREDVGDTLAYWLLVGREYGEYVWDAAMHAGHEFAIAPVGLAALQDLAGT